MKSKGLQTKSAAALELGLPTIKFEKEYFLTLIMCNNQANSILSASNCSIVDGKFLAIVSVCCDDLQEYFSKHIYSAQQQIVFSNANESFSGHLTVNHNRSDEFYRNRNCISFTFFKKVSNRLIGDIYLVQCISRVLLSHYKLLLHLTAFHFMITVPIVTEF